jgi:hypothetical protein
MKLGTRYSFVEGLSGYRGCSSNGLTTAIIFTPCKPTISTRLDTCSNVGQPDFFHLEFGVRR